MDIDFEAACWISSRLDRFSPCVEIEGGPVEHGDEEIVQMS
jgi:hypothetical protein